MRYVLDKIMSIEPLAVKQAADVLRLDNCTEDDVKNRIAAAREAAEGYTGFDYVNKIYKVYSDELSSCFCVKKLPFLELISVKATLANGTIQDITDKYSFFPQSSIICQKESFELPELALYDAICFEIKTGFENVPEKVVDAIKWYVQNSFNGVNPSEWMQAFKNLLGSSRQVHV